MFLGHFAIGFALKKAEPRLSLGTLVAGAMAMDIAFAVLLLFGVEHVRISPGATVVSPFEFYDYPYSHSALGSFVMAGMVFLLTRTWLFKGSVFKTRASFVLAVAVFSHFILDFVSHTPDMPLAGNESMKLGLSLWNSMPGTLVVEFGLLVIGVLLYFATTRSTSVVGKYGVAVIVSLLVLLFTGGLIGPPPPDSVSLAIFIIVGLLIFISLSYWVDRHRAIRV
jgi:hypothetical protein